MIFMILIMTGEKPLFAAILGKMSLFFIITEFF